MEDRVAHTLMLAKISQTFQTPTPGAPADAIARQQELQVTSSPAAHADVKPFSLSNQDQLCQFQPHLTGE